MLHTTMVQKSLMCRQGASTSRQTTPEFSFSVDTAVGKESLVGCKTLSTAGCSTVEYSGICRRLTCSCT